ncbi:MAG: LysM peptidoglycan-binding domain-containing protein [Verrucomicrobiota bacterium]
MKTPWVGVWSLVACGSLFSQTTVRPLTAASKPEPGLELAVTWKWWVVPPEVKEWGMPLPESLRPKPAGDPAPEPTVVRPETYEVSKGDAIIKIARKFEMEAWQLKQFNNLKDDRIQIGQVLRIPSPGQLLTMVPPPPPPEKEVASQKKSNKAIIIEEPAPDLDPGGEIQQELDNVRMQVFLDREMFSPGMIDGKEGPAFLKVREIYQKSRPDAANSASLKAKAEAAVKEPYTRYALRADDFKFIRPPKAEPVVVPDKGSASARKKNPKPDIPAPPPLTIDDLVGADFLGYGSAWEFVAERFHCDEEFLHHINPQLKDAPVVGTDFQVPNVIPFEIEKALDAPLQPAADPQKPITAAVVLVSRLEISRDGQLIAVMPLRSARPGLYGRDKWTVLDAIPQPRMATKREPREPPKSAPATKGVVNPDAGPGIAQPLEKEQYLAPGPNNPVGVIWINLAKSGGIVPLPYGLHGTGIPAKMASLQSIGGFRLTNWDITRAARLMPAGTVLQWKKE